MLDVRALEAGYGRARVLFGISLELRAGEIAVLAGPNGAGKSTTLKAIMGLLPGISGEVTFTNKRIENLPSFEIARLGLGYVPEDRRLFGELTVAENLEAGRLPPRAGAPQWTPASLAALFPVLDTAARRPAASLSGGEQKMLAIARTLMGNPKAVLLDEPSEGIAPVLAARLAQALVELKRAGVSVLLCEQNRAFAARVADRRYFIERGRIVDNAA